VSLEITVAAPFRYMRKDRLRKSEFIYFLAIDRKWMNRDQAGSLIAIATNSGLITQDGEYLKPEFDVSAVTVPLGFKPPSDIFDRPDHVQELLRRISESRDIALTEVVAEMNSLINDHFDGKIRPEAGAVILCRKYGIAFEDKLDLLKQALK